MRKIFFIIVAMLFAMNASAQIKVIETITEADTLIYTTRVLDAPADLYKGTKGYLIRTHNQTVGKVEPVFYLGRDKQTAITALEDLAKLCECDVATTYLIEDADGCVFSAYTTKSTMVGSVTARKPIYVQADRFFLRNDKFEFMMMLSAKQLEDLKKFLQK